MSTRGQILFKFPDGQVLVYRHSDSYPYTVNGVVADLVEFFKWNMGRNTQYDYMIANYFYWMKKPMEYYIDYDWKLGKKKRNSVPIHKRKLDGNESVKIGHGLDYHGKLHGDIEWFYLVEFFERPTEDIFKEDKYLTVIIKVYELHAFNIEYEYPEQLLRNEMPKMTFTIEDIENYKLEVPKWEDEE